MNYLKQMTLVHARAAEDKFVSVGYGVQPRDVMYNDFILVGPESDPAGIRGGRDVLKAMRRMFNPYGIIAVNPAHIRDVNYDGAMRLIEWITSPEGEARIAAFKVQGQPVFFPVIKP